MSDLFCGESWSRYIKPVGKTTLDNSDQAYHRLPELAYYMNILSNHMWADWYDFKDNLKEKVKKLVRKLSFVEWQDFIKMERDEIRRLQKELPDIYIHWNN